jgi:cellulose 1,4-beta-cellobiosidase
VSSNSRTVRVGWVPVSGASSYTVYDSTTGATGTYSSLTTGATGTSYTTSTLGAGTHYFKIAAVAGSKWTGSQSAATVARTIRSTGTLCA